VTTPPSPYEHSLEAIVRQKRLEQQEPDFAFDSPESRLNAVQMDEFIATCLVQCYADYIRGRDAIPAGHFTGFLARFELAGRRLNELSVGDQAIADAIVAQAARV
jgi:hypothetical protein